LNIHPILSPFLVNIGRLRCHEKSSSNYSGLLIITLAILVLSVEGLAQPPASQPNQSIFVPRPGAPPHDTYIFEAEAQDFTKETRHLRGKAKIETDTMQMQADQIDFNTDTHDLRATGHVYYQNFKQKEEIWADDVVYNTQSETGTFYNVRGESATHIAARPGLLTTNQPFYFQGEWAQRLEDRYILHNGFITNCKAPHYWWTLRGPVFDIIPQDRAKAYDSIFYVRQIPLFFVPYFYKSLEKVPRKSGFLLPSFGNSSIAGPFLHMGYFWAINRSYDMTYRFMEYFERGESHDLEFRGKPRVGTDFDAIFYGVQDRGISQPSGPPVTYSGLSATVNGKSDLGDGWNAVGQLNYITSFRFRQEWSFSFNEAVFSEVHSAGYLDKSWSDYTFITAVDHMTNFETTEIPIIPPPTSYATGFANNAVVVRKLPEVDLTEHEHQIWNNIPLWFSFGSSAGLLDRSEPLFNCEAANTPPALLNCPSIPSVSSALVEHFQTNPFMGRLDFAPHLTSELRLGDFHIVPRFGIQETFYSQSQALSASATQALDMPTYQVIDTSLLRSSRDVSVDLIFPSLARVFSKKTIFGDKLKHVIEPRVTYNYVGGIGSEFSRFIPFDETELLANTSELEWSLTNRIYAKHGDATDEIFTWEVAQKRFFDPTFGGALLPGQANLFLTTAELTPYAFLTGPRTYSPIDSVIHARPVARLGIDWATDWDPLYGRFTNSTVSLDYRWSRYYVSFGRNFVNYGASSYGVNSVLSAPANQYRFGGGYGEPNHRGWNAGFVGIYDTIRGVLQYAISQVTYNTDCCGLSVQWRLINIGTQTGNIYTPQRDQSEFRVSFTVANLGSVGNLRRQDRLF
jgi:LPS-assembly protein